MVLGEVVVQLRPEDDPLGGVGRHCATDDYARLAWRFQTRPPAWMSFSLPLKWLCRSDWHWQGRMRRRRAGAEGGEAEQARTFLVKIDQTAGSMRQGHTGVKSRLEITLG